MKQRREIQRRGVKEEKLRGLLPTQRQKKRFIRFVINSDTPFSYEQFSSAFLKQLERYLGVIDMGLFGIWLLKDQFSEKNQEGIIRVSIKGQEKTCAALALIDEIQRQPTHIEVRKVSGTLKGAWEPPRNQK
jgi:RNase P/RNase MRP subunit POP5